MTHGPPTRHSPCFVCAAFTSIKACGVAAHHFACHCIAMIPAANAARRTCVPCARNLFLSNAKTPLPPSHILPQTSASGGSCARLPGMRHEDDLVCSPGYDTCDGRPIRVNIARDPGLWRSAVASEVGRIGSRWLETNVCLQLALSAESSFACRRGRSTIYIYRARKRAHPLREQALIRQCGATCYHDRLMRVLKTKAQSAATSPLSPTQQPPQAGFLVTCSVACATPCPTRPTDTNILERTARAQGSNAALKPSEGLI